MDTRQFPVPTQAEIQATVARARRMQSQAIAAGFGAAWHAVARWLAHPGFAHRHA